MEASAARAETAKRKRQSAIEKQEHEVAEKWRAVHDTDKPVSEINFVEGVWKCRKPESGIGTEWEQEPEPEPETAT